MGQIATFPTNLPPAAITRIAGKMVTRYSPTEIADAIELLMDLLDALGGDPDLEETDPLEDDDPREQDDPTEDDDADEAEGHDEHDDAADVPAIHVYDAQTREFLGMNAGPNFVGKAPVIA